jgi:hypothetical protein
VPVVGDSKLVGIVNRANLVRALATTTSAPATDADPGDRGPAPQRTAWKEVGGHFVGGHNRPGPDRASLVLRRPAARERLTFRVAAENIPGVLRVEEHIVAAPASEVRPGSRVGQT